MSASEHPVAAPDTPNGGNPRTPAIQAHCITSERELTTLRGEWDELWQRCPWSTPFQMPEWQLAWWRHLGGGELRVITLRLGARLVGLAPMFLHGPADAPRRLAMLGTGISDYEDALLDPEFGALGAAAIFREIDSWRQDWSSCALRELRSTSPLLHARVPRSLHAQIGESSVCPVLPLADSFEALEHGMGHTHRRKLHLCRNRLQRAGGTTLTLAGATDVHQLIDELAGLHERRWHERTGHGVLADPRIRALHHDTAPALLARGCLRLFALRLNGAIIAVLYAIAWRGRLYCYLNGIDPDARYYSPGVAILRGAIEHAIAHGMREVDFLRGAERYKYLWGAVDRQNHELRLQPRECHAEP